MRSYYWSCSKFADWLRGTAKLKAATAEGWDDWHEQAKTKHSFRYWLAEEGLDKLQKVVYLIPDKIHAVKYYINNRFVTRTHALTAHPRDIKPGTWCDVGNRFLPCLFNELQEFVEIELAWHHIAWNEEAREEFKAPWYASGWFRWRTWRCPEAGLASLEWQSKLDNTDYVTPNDPSYGEPTKQAINAREIISLYKWWTEVYRNRPDPMDAGGWTEVCKEARKENGDGVLSLMKETKNKDLKKRKKKALALTHRIEKAYAAEDEKMMIRLIKIKDSLWT